MWKYKNYLLSRQGFDKCQTSAQTDRSSKGQQISTTTEQNEERRSRANTKKRGMLKIRLEMVRRRDMQVDEEKKIISWKVNPFQKPTDQSWGNEEEEDR